MTERLRFLLTLALLGLLGFAGMTVMRSRNGDESSGSTDAVKRVMSADAPLESGKFKFEVKARVDGVPQLAAPLVVAGSGAFQTYDKKGKAPDFDFKAGVSVPGFNEQVGARMARGALYLMQDGQFFTIAEAGKVRALTQTGKDSKKTDGSKFVSDVRDEGAETLDGVQTDHVSMQIDMAALFDEMENGDVPAEMRTLLDEAVREARLDLWAGRDDQKIRKVAFHLAFKTPDRLQQQAQGMTGGQLDAEVSFTEVGKPQRIRAPRNARGLDELGSQFGQIFSAGMLGGVTDGGASAKKREAPQRDTDPKNYDAETRQYLACVARAAKPEALDKCIAGLR